MDGHKFDNITRGLASSTSRRSVLKGLAGGAVGGELAAGGVSHSAARAANPCAASRSLINEIIAIIARLLGSVGIPFPELGEPIECEGNRTVNPDTCDCYCPLTGADCPGQMVPDTATCECYCPLTVNECPGGVDSGTCECIAIVCDQLQDPCGADELTCTCAELDVSEDPVCVDRTSFSGHACGGVDDDPCPSGAVCAYTEDCGGSYCFPLCGEAAAFSHIPNKLV